MYKLETFISKKFRPEILSSKLDKEHFTRLNLSLEKNLEKFPVKFVNSICFGPKKDNVLITLEHAANKIDSILVFYYEDIHSRWSYINYNEECLFIYRKNDQEQFLIKPKLLYIRGCSIGIDDENWTVLGNFFSYIELWDDKVLCSPQKQTSNESKLFQLNNSIKKVSKDFTSISIGKSYVVKGVNRYKQLDKDISYIVKSLSGIRSLVVDNASYEKWNLNNLDSLPTLFQEKVNGSDLRIHTLYDKLFAKLSIEKDNVDYRYDKAFFNLKEIKIRDTELVAFCREVSKEESNPFLGIDFIKTKSRYVVLEANPSPGWSAYYPYNGIDLGPFIPELLSVLKNG